MPRRACYLLYAVLLVAIVPGCVSLYSYRPVSVLVRDAETKKPIPAAEVSILYPVSSGSFPPRQAHGLTSGDGIARLQAAPYGDIGVTLAGAVNGYMPEEMDVSVEGIRKIEPEHWYKHGEPRPVNFVLEMYAAPRPTVELVLPEGYRGLIKATLKTRQDMPCTPGQRTFTCTVPASGIVEVQGPPLLEHFAPPDYRARYTDGTPLNPKPGPMDIGLRFLRAEADEEYFVVGTESDFMRLRRGTRPQPAEGRPASSGNGGRRGGGHHRGGQQFGSDPGTN